MWSSNILLWQQKFLIQQQIGIHKRARENANHVQLFLGKLVHRFRGFGCNCYLLDAFAWICNLIERNSIPQFIINLFTDLMTQMNDWSVYTEWNSNAARFFRWCNCFCLGTDIFRFDCFDMRLHGKNFCHWSDREKKKTHRNHNTAHRQANSK